MGTQVRKPTAERRAEIARAALALIGQHGPTAFTTSRLAEAVGVTSGALFRHFASLDEVLEEAVRLAVEQIDDTFPDPARPPTERLFGLVRARVALLRREPGVAWLLRSEQALSVLPGAAVTQLEALIARSRRFLATAIQEGVAEGGIRDDLPPQSLLLIVTGTVHSLVGLGGLHGRASARQKKSVERVIDALVTMCSPEGGGTAARRRKKQ